MKVTAPPIKGQANNALLTFMAQVLAVPKSDLSIMRGFASRHKVIAIHGLTPEALKEKLAQALPGKQLPLT